jgi:hypothetical protein
MTTSARSIHFAWLTLVGMAGDIWCANSHFCIDGHLYHGEKPGWWVYADLLWAGVFVAAAVLVLRSDVPTRLAAFGLLVGLCISRLALGSGGGGLFVFEVAAGIYVVILAMLAFCGVRRKMGPTPETRCESV